MTDKTHAEVMRMVVEDCATDARALDSTPFTPRGMGEAFGNILAQIAAVARAVEALHIAADSAPAAVAGAPTAPRQTEEPG